MTTIFNDHENDHVNCDIVGYCMIVLQGEDIVRMIDYNRLEGKWWWQGATTSLSALSKQRCVVSISG